MPPLLLAVCASKSNFFLPCEDTHRYYNITQHAEAPRLDRNVTIHSHFDAKLSVLVWTDGGSVDPCSEDVTLERKVAGCFGLAKRTGYYYKSIVIDGRRRRC